MGKEHAAGGASAEPPVDADPEPVVDEAGGLTDEGAAAKERTPLVNNPEPKAAAPGEAGHAGAFHAFINTFKAFIGAGVLGMPFGFRMAGWLGGLVVLVVIAVTSAYTAKLLLRAKNCARKRAVRRLVQGGMRAEEAREATVHLTYPEVGREALPEGHVGERMTAFFLALTQLGSCTAYVIFMANNLNSIDPTWPARWMYVFVLLPPLIFLSFIRDIDLLFPLSLAGTALLAIGIVLIAGHATSEWAPPDTFRVTDLHGMTIFAGMAIFAMVIPIEESMRRPKHYPAVLNGVYALLLVTYTTVGIFFWAMFGNDVASVLTLNFPVTLGGYLARACLCAYIMATYVLCLFPVSELFDHWAKEHGDDGLASRVMGHPYVLRTALVLFTAILASSTSNFAPVLGLVGYVGFGVQGFLAPALFFIRLHEEEEGEEGEEGEYTASLADVVLPRVILLVGALVVVAGTITSMHDLAAPAP